MLLKLKVKFYRGSATHHICFLLAVWISITLFLFSESPGTYSEIHTYQSIGSLMFIIAIYINPFFNWMANKKYLKMNIEKITGLNEHYWLQAGSIIEKNGKESLALITLRETDDILTQNQRKDFRKVYLATDTILKSRNI